MLARHQDPIAAIATAPGRGAVGIVRVSGRGLAPFVQDLLGRAAAAPGALPALSRRPGPAHRPRLALFFPAPHSYTGEDVLELQAHGGPVVLQPAAGALPGGGADRSARACRAWPSPASSPSGRSERQDRPAQAEAIADLMTPAPKAQRAAPAARLGRVLQRDPRPARRPHPPAHAGRGHADFPQEEIDFLRKADARDSYQFAAKPWPA